MTDAMMLAANPFVKRAPVVKTGPIPSSPNPFATKTKGSKAVDLQRTDSFFGRVEGKVATKGTSHPLLPREDN
jgi:hypothetical protein